MELSHECIAPFLGLVVEDQGPGLVSLWYNRGNLLRFTSRPYHASINREILCHDVAAGLHYLHNHEPPIIHGDLKGVRVHFVLRLAVRWFFILISFKRLGQRTHRS